ncbi:MAG: NfeD family protein [Chloroflexota bacterium]
MLNFLLDPNVAYLLLAAGVLMTVFALITPGTGVIEIGALFLLVLAGWGMYNLPINFWALALLFVGVVLLILAIRWYKQWIYLASSILALIVGSVFLFRGDQWWVPAVNPILAGIISLASAALLWFVGRKALEARAFRPTHELGALMGQIGEAKTDVHEHGSVQVAGELWSARSEEPIHNGTLVRVIGREGFVLDVEAVRDGLPG